jgi:predicted MPP superfamily phosphohydrolase
MPLRFAHAGDFHLDEDRYFADTAQCLEWFVADAIWARVDFFVINGDLTTYWATIKERNFWVDRLVEMANHAPVILVGGNHGAELEGDLYVFGRAKGKHPIYLFTEPEFIELDDVAVAVFPYEESTARWHTQSMRSICSYASREVRCKPLKTAKQPQYPL